MAVEKDGKGRYLPNFARPSASTKRSRGRAGSLVVNACITEESRRRNWPAELVRLKKEQERLTKDIASKERQLGDETFRSRAPEKIIQGLQVTLEERRIELKKLIERLKELESGN